MANKEKVAWTESFAANHLRMAEHLVSQAEEIEDEYEFEVGPPKSTEQLRIDDVHDSTVMYSIISSVSYLESLINELYHDHYWHITELEMDIQENEINGLIDDENFVYFFEKYAEIEGNSFARKPTLEKYQLFLIMADKEPFNRGVLPYQDVNSLVSVRNYFVHYEPEIYEEKAEEDHIEHEIGSSLQGKFELNPIARDSAPFFPHQCLSSDFAEWAVVQSKDFVEEFFKKLQIEPAPTPATAHIELDSL